MNKPPEFTDKCCLSFVLCLVFQLCPTLCDSIDCSLPSSSVHGDSPGKILEWVLAIVHTRSSSVALDSVLFVPSGRVVAVPGPFFPHLSISVKDR